MAPGEAGPEESASPLFAEGLEMGKQVGGAGPAPCCSATEGLGWEEHGEEGLLSVVSSWEWDGKGEVSGGNAEVVCGMWDVTRPSAIAPIYSEILSKISTLNQERCV